MDVTILFKMKNLFPLFLRLLIFTSIISVIECDDHITECEEMEITIDIRDNSVEVTWTPNSCAFLYMVTHFVNGVERNTVALPDPIVSTSFERVTCSRNIITIDILQSPDTGTFIPPSKDFVIGLEGSSAVQNLKFVEERGQFEWDAPDNSKGCELEYKINFSNGITTNEIVIEDLFYQFLPYYCSSNEIIVTTIIGIEEMEGETVSEIYSIAAPDIKEVIDLKFDEDLSRFQWNAPDRSELCGFEYEIKFENQKDIIETRTSDEFFEITVHPCTSNIISVITLFGDVKSEAVTASHNGPITRELPVHIRTNPHENSAEVTWYIEHEPYSFCEIDELRYEVIHVETEDEMQFHDDFVEGVDVDFVLTSLEVNQMYQYRLCYVLLAPDLFCSPYITFITHPLPKPVITTEINANEDIEISWDQNYYSSFVSGHTIIIEPIEPNHFVPSDCHFDKTPIQRDFNTEVTSYIFEDSKPSFKYSIQVITHFDELGIATSDENVIDTNEAIPGQLNIQSSYEFGSTLSYDASLLITWRVPCDINGKLQRFSYEVTSVSNPDFISICSDISLASGVITVVEDVQETYDIPVISRIFPFFKYSVEITTHLENYESITFLNLEDPPHAYTPPY